MENQNALSKTTIWLHWLVAAIMIFMLAVGAYMALTGTFGLYEIHKSIGVLVFILLLARVVWRLKQGWPQPVCRYSAIDQLLAKFTHWALLLGTLAIPLTGMLYSGASGHGFGIFGLTIVPTNHDLAEQVIPYSQKLNVFGETAHEWIGYGLIAVLCLHTAGALKHHLIDHDGTLRRMLGKSV